MSREYPDRPVAGVGAVIIERGRVLLVRRGSPPRAGHWSLPGGAQELGETFAEACVRETREETGLVVEVLGLVDVVDSIARDDAGRVRYHYLLADVLARPAGGTLKAASDVTDARWFTPDEAFALPLWSETARVIRKGFALAATLTATGH
ncbi:MAG: NUDIX domain-containing protein [Rhodospirillales bacterium]|nr:NUDIX domain-containing protein [Rhodospirillales bacterium]MSP80512.1 NUDIX domain-containing protein [Rhodospirillales bacterium]